MTRAIVVTGYTVRSILQNRNIGEIKLEYCNFNTTSLIDSYNLMPIGHEEKAETVGLTNENILKWSHSCTGLRINGISGDSDVLHTIRHVIINAGCIVAKCSPQNLAEIFDPDFIVIHDESPMGTNGFSKTIYENFERVIEVAKDLLLECPCHKEQKTELPDLNGCPNCTFFGGYCIERNKGLKKLGALELLNRTFPPNI
jgi:ATP-dependent helicase YprA (DUF1998 family)